MLRTISCVLLLALSSAPAFADSRNAVPAASRAARADGWPATRAGEIGRAYVAAFSSGVPAMRAFDARELGAASLAERPIEARLERYRELRERYGRLVLASILKSAPNELTASLMDMDGALHEFEFSTTPAGRLATVRIREKRNLHGLFGFHH